MRVAIVQESMDPRRGGAETSVLEMAAALAANGAAPTILYNAGRDAEATAPAPAGVELLPHTPPRPMTRLQLARWFLAATDESILTGSFDIIHAVTPHPRADVYQPRGGIIAETVERSIARGRSPLARWAKRIGRIFHAKQRFLDRIEQSLFAAGSPVRVAAVSDYVRRQVVSRHPHMRERVEVVFNAVNVARLALDDPATARQTARNRLHLVEHEPAVLFVAHNFKLKGLPELLRTQAIGAAAGRAWKLLIVGRDDPVPHLRTARRLGIENRVRFIEAGEEMRRLYAAADVLAHPTWYDPCSRVVLEALCSGLPVVTTRWNGAAEAMTPGRHGAVVDTPEDRGALAAAIESALRPECRAACQADAPRFREQLSMDRHARELIALYRRVLEQRR